jgi:hypothetical protein
MHSTRFAVAIVLSLASSAQAGPVIGVLSASRQGGMNLIDNAGATQLRQAILSAYPSVVFQVVDPLTPAGLAGCDTVLVAVANSGNSAINPLSGTEQAALRAFVDSGGGAVLFTDNDSFSGGASTPANNSVVGAFGVTTGGTGSPWQQFASVPPILPPNLPDSPVIYGPFGQITSYTVGWSGWFPGAALVPGAVVLATLDQNLQPALVEFPPHALAPLSGRAVLFSDTTMVYNGYLSETSRVAALNAIDATLARCGPADVGRQGGFPGPDHQLDNNDFIAFIDYFFALNPVADRGVVGGLPGHDGQFDNNDFIVFIGQFFDGCG